MKVRGWKNIFHANGKQKKAGIAIFILDKIDLKIKKIIRDKEVPGATTGDPTDDKVMWKRTVKQGFRTQRAP